MVPPYQQRVITEREELAKKLESLLAFLNGPVAMTLPNAEHELLLSQRAAMMQYLDALDLRIALWGRKTA